jgi:dihydrofolate reductase
MNVSVDGYIERAAGEHESEAPPWVRIDEPLHEHFNEQARGLALMVEGRVVYEMMESYWPAARTDDSEPPVMQEFGHIWTDMPKVLVSRTRTSAEHNTRIVGGDDDALEQLATIREETDGPIGVGGATLATAMLEAGLLDELLLYVHPAVLGSGRPLFDQLSEPLLLEPVELVEFENGVVMRRFQILR